MRSQVASCATCARSSRAGTSRATDIALPWEHAAWLDGAVRWIDARIERSGDVELVKTAPWSAIVRVPTADGDVWFKENSPAGAFEPALTELLVRRHPDRLPEVIAWEGPRILTRDAGPRLRAVFDAGATEPAWEDVLPLYAELQLDFIADVPAALELGAPDERPHHLRRRYRELSRTRELEDRVAHAVAQLADGIPSTVVHMEAHDGNIFVREGRAVFLDWAEAAVTHPFVGPLLALRSATERLGYQPGSAGAERLRDLYLEPFTRFATMNELRSAFAAGYLLAPIARAHNWHRTLAPLPDSVRIAYEDPVAAWLEILGGIADGTITLGGA